MIVCTMLLPPATKVLHLSHQLEQCLSQSKPTTKVCQVAYVFMALDEIFVGSILSFEYHVISIGLFPEHVQYVTYVQYVGSLGYQCRICTGER